MAAVCLARSFKAIRLAVSLFRFDRLVIGRFRPVCSCSSLFEISSLFSFA